MAGFALEGFVDFARALGQQKQPAGNEDQVATRYGMPEHGEERRGQSDDPRKRREERDAGDHRAEQSDAPRATLLLLGEFPRQDGNEDDVVDAEDDLEHRQCEQTEPGFWTREDA